MRQFSGAWRRERGLERGRSGAIRRVHRRQEDCRTRGARSRVKGFCEAVQVRRVSLTPPPSIRWYRLYPMPLQRRPSPGSGRPGASWHRWRVDRGDGLGEAASRGSAYVNRLELVDHQAAPACGNGQDLMARSAAACPPTSRTDGKRHDFLALKSIDAHPPA